MKHLFSPKEVADAIGVSESSLKRWVDSGALAATRTAGGHRRIALAEAIRFIRDARVPLLRPTLLGLPQAAASSVSQPDALPDRAAHAERLYTALGLGRSADTRGLILSMYLAGHSVAEICDGPVRAAMERLGELYRHEDRGIFVEHRATDLCILALNNLRQLIEVPAGAPRAVGGAPSGDPYVIPSLAAAAALAAEGFSAVNLGPETPDDALSIACAELRPSVVWISVTSQRIADETVDRYAALCVKLHAEGVAVVLGGQARHRVAPRLPATVYNAASIGELVAFARGRLVSAAAVTLASNDT